MTIRNFQPGDEAAQVSIYNEAAASLPKFKPATLNEVRRRRHAADYDPSTRFLALAADLPVGYCGFQPNGRVGYPWCRRGHEEQAEPLFQAVLDAIQARSIKRAFAAYRGDWPVQNAFFRAHGFTPAREMINFVLPLVELPTPSARPSNLVGAFGPADVPALFALAPGVLRADSPAALEQQLCRNPWFGSDSIFVLRDRSTGSPLGAAVLIVNPEYADPTQVDSNMPCFRLGAFGTEGMQTKRIKGLFSFLTSPGNQAGQVGLEFLNYAALVLQETDLSVLAAQVPSDAPHLLRFYTSYFRRQGSFPILERVPRG